MTERRFTIIGLCGLAACTSAADGRNDAAVATVDARPDAAPDAGVLPDASTGRLVFMTQPQSTRAGLRFATPVQVMALPAPGQTLPGDQQVTLAVANQPGQAGFTVATQFVSAGVATFPDLAIERPGRAYRLVATAEGFAPATSDAFDVAPGAWTPARAGMPLGWANLIVADRSASATLYAGLFEGGIATSSDGGATWSRLDAFPGHRVTSLVVAPSTRGWIYAESDAGIHRSEDGGASWTLVRADSRLPGITALQTMAVDAMDPWTAYARTANGVGIMSTHDGGTTWRVVLQTRQGGFGSLFANPLRPGTVYARADGASYRSTDGGATWEAWQPPFGRLLSLAVDDSATPARLYFATDSGAFVSDDAGDSWTHLDGMGFMMSLVVDPAHHALWGVAVDGVYRSLDGGATFARVDGLDVSWGLQPGVALAVAAGPAPAVVVGLQSALWRSGDGGATWSTLPALSQSYVQALVMAPGSPRTLFAHTGSWTWKTSDGGDHWSSMSGPLLQTRNGTSAAALAVDPAAPLTICVGTADGMRRSSDGGATWAPAAELPGQVVQALAFEAGNGHALWAATPTSAYRSTGAEGWHEVTLPEGPAPQPSLTADPRAPGTIYLGGMWATSTWKTSGAGWSSVTPSWGASAIAFVPGDAQRMFLGGQSGVDASRDGGATWTLALRRDYVTSLAVDPTDAGIVYAGAYAGLGHAPTLLKSRDGGATWTDASSGLGRSSGVSALAMDPGAPRVLYAGGAGVFKTTRGGD